VSFRDGSVIVNNPTIEQVRSYYTILADLYKTKVKLPLFPLKFFEKLYELESSRFLLVEYNGEIFGGTVCVCLQNKTMFEWFVCGKDGVVKNIFPSEVATYAGLQCSVDDNCAKFDMMGAGSPNVKYGVRDFKAKFGGQLVEHGRYLCVLNKLSYSLGKLGVKLLKKK
jgi:lipid II:glycine glycyltransferase (peptidoglycan interpeptide bridge formation enzyme)